MKAFRILSLGLLIIISVGCGEDTQSSTTENEETQADGVSSSSSQSATENEETQAPVATDESTSDEGTSEEADDSPATTTQYEEAQAPPARDEPASDDRTYDESAAGDSSASATQYEEGPDEPAFDQPQLSLPPNGEVRYFTQAAAVAPFEVQASAGSNYLVKLVDANSGLDVLDVFVGSGSTIEVSVPLGSYAVKYAAGADWYGYEYYFGPETMYSEADEIFYFQDDGYQYTGYTITLYPVVGGTLSTSDIAASEF